MTDLEGITLVPEPTEERLNERQLVDYRSQRESCLDWLLHFSGSMSKIADDTEGGFNIFLQEHYRRVIYSTSPLYTGSVYSELRQHLQTIIPHRGDTHV